MVVAFLSKAGQCRGFRQLQICVSDVVCCGQAKFDIGMGSRDSSVRIVTRLRAGQRRDRGSISGRGRRIVSNPQRPDGFWGPPVFQNSKNRERFARSEAA